MLHRELQINSAASCYTLWQSKITAIFIMPWHIHHSLTPSQSLKCCILHSFPVNDSLWEWLGQCVASTQFLLVMLVDCPGWVIEQPCNQFVMLRPHCCNVKRKAIRAECSRPTLYVRPSVAHCMHVIGCPGRGSAMGSSHGTST